MTNYTELEVLNFTVVNVNQSQNGTVLLHTITIDNWKLFVCLIAISTVFLLISVIIYILLFDKQNVHGWTQFSYLVSLLLFNIVFIPALFPLGIAQSTGKINMACFILSASNQYFFIVSKTWLLIIGLDILWNLWKFEYIVDSRKHGKRFLTYTFIGWGFPCGFVICGVMLNLSHRETLLTSVNNGELMVPIPNYGHLHCRIPNWIIWEIFVFSNCLLHISIFFLIIFIILRHRCSIKDNIDSSCSKKRSSYSIMMFLKLFIVVGLSWSYIALQDLLKAGNINTHQNWGGWQLFRIVFFLQGTFISVVYVGNVKTLRQLQTKFPKFNAFVKRLQSQFGWISSSMRQRASIFSLTFSGKSLSLSDSSLKHHSPT